MTNNAETIKPYDNVRAKTIQVRQMFDSIAPAYDWMNRAMTFGLDKIWRRKAVAIVAKSKPQTVVDLATGTGDVAIDIAKKIPSAFVTGIDLSPQMVEIGRQKVAKANLASRVNLQTGNCLQLPLPAEEANAVTVSYGVRNFENLRQGYAEMFRILKPGGLLCVVELSTPTNPFVKPFYWLYTRLAIPLVGRLVSKDPRAYSYLPESIAAVPQGEQMLDFIRQAGFASAMFKPLTFGVCTIYTAFRPNRPS